MTLTRDNLLRILPSFKNRKVEIIRDQSVKDIIKNLLIFHNKYKTDYDKIANSFVGVDDAATIKNIFEFLKKEIEYYQEPTEFQTLRSPSAIIAMGKNDCKNYALFIAGVLDALNRKGYYFPFVFRFASYNVFTKTPGHVFVVVYPGSKNEIWVDPVLDELDEKKQPYYITDKKTNNMALVGIAGVNQQKKVGAIEFEAAQGVLDTILNISNLFKADNSENWTATDWGWYLVKDPATHPAYNFIIFFKNNPEFLKSYPYSNPDTGHVYTMNEKIELVRNRMNQAGFGQQADAILLQNGYISSSNYFPGATSTSQYQPTKAGMNMLVTLGIVGAGLFFILKKNK